MKLSTFVLSAAFGSLIPLAAHADIERTIEKKFTVQPAGLVHVETFGGGIRVESAETNEVKIVAKLHFKASTEQEADEYAKEATISIEQTENQIDAVVERVHTNILKWGKPAHMSVDFVVTVPSRFDANLKTSGGNIVVGDLSGEIKAHTSGGDIKLSRIAGPISAMTSGGSIVLKEGTGRTVLKTSGGDVHVDQAGGETDVTTSGGNIVVNRAEDSLKASTSGGNITAVFIGSLKGDSELRTSGGDLNATVEPISAFTLDAKTEGGLVKVSGLSVTSAVTPKNGGRLEGTVNGGGPTLKLRTSGGNVMVASKS